ncbi:Gmad2 immunoglobulin-like domain-containing protein [Paenibacillus humicola]|uniref:Gmad2 immunoglobulin-like domain-containing protein n=1 Tax=Paenibacillus humicola TaxID=3110540 RepID=UPI00237BD4B3|nr:Gmad2 immunoglobulin-like domain-containing protein [Paenibacillus humicola]
MRRQNGLLKLALIGVAALLASCSPEQKPANAGGDKTAEEDRPEVQAFDKGTVIEKEGNRWLITAYDDQNGTPAVKAIWFTADEQTVIQDSTGQAASADGISVGAQVEAWHTGAVRESYPEQAAAAKIVVHDDPQDIPEGLIGRAQAVKAALHASPPDPSSAALAVKDAVLDTERGIWNVELAAHETIDKPVAVRIDARSGEPVQAPVAENDAFRVFSPKPGTEAGPSFTVEGEARVFEAAFSWKLEDGHYILAEGHEMADEGGPAWGHFRFDVSYEKASQADMQLILFVYSAKDGSVEHQLVIPLKVPEPYIAYEAG